MEPRGGSGVPASRERPSLKSEGSEKVESSCLRAVRSSLKAARAAFDSVRQSFDRGKGVEEAIGKRLGRKLEHRAKLFESHFDREMAQPGDAPAASIFNSRNFSEVGRDQQVREMVLLERMMNLVTLAAILEDVVDQILNDLKPSQLRQHPGTQQRLQALLSHASQVIEAIEEMSPRISNSGFFSGFQIQRSKVQSSIARARVQLETRVRS